MKIIEMNSGKKMDYAVDGTKLTLDGGRLAVDLQKYQRDYPITLDFVTDGEGNLTLNDMGNLRAYVAEVELPAYETEVVEVESAAEQATDEGEAVEADGKAKSQDDETAEDATPAETVDDGEDPAAESKAEDSSEQNEGDSASLAAEEEQTVIYKRLPLDMDKVVLRLWCVEPLYINQFGDAE